MTDEAQSFRSGFVAVVGRPNVGKSTLINAILGQKIAAVSPRPQTTRRRQLGILTTDHAQVIFVDTPGLHKPVHRLGAFMNEEVAAAMADVDVIIFMVDASQPPTDEDRLVAERLAALPPGPAVIITLNKTDLIGKERLAEFKPLYQALLPEAAMIAISAASGFQRDRLLEEVILRLPVGPPLYDEDQITDLYEREIAADLVREAALLHLKDEVPHGIAVRVDEFRERGESGAYIIATLFVERESHKPIVIGQGGEMLKKIGSSARAEIEKMSGRKVFLELRVKVQKNWRASSDDIRNMGFIHPEDV